MKLLKIFRIVFIAVFCMMLSSAALAVPETINYQGHIDAAGIPYDGIGAFRFALVDESGSIQYWSNDGNNPPEFDVAVTVTDGLYNVLLGYSNGMDPIPAAVFENEPVFLRIWFNDGSKELQQLSPDQRITSVGYAFQAETAMNADTVDGMHYSAGWPTTQENIQTALSNDFHAIGGDDDDQPDDDSEVPDDISIDNGRLYAPSGAGNVGIGTISPSESLEVIGKVFAEDGVIVGVASNDGMYISSAGNPAIQSAVGTFDGVKVLKAGYPTQFQESIDNCGFEVAGSEGFGMFVGHTDMTGVYINSASHDGFNVYSAGNPSQNLYSSVHDGFEVAGAEGNGVYVGHADMNGVLVTNALDDGIHIIQSGGDGVHVTSAGTPSMQYASGLPNGLEVEGAQNHGIYLGRADQDGIQINSAGDDGLYITTAVDDGVAVSSAGEWVCTRIRRLKTTNGGVYTPDKIFAGVSVASNKFCSYGKNVGSKDLEPGDLVCIADGFEENVLFDGDDSLLYLKKISSGSYGSVIGVVEHRAAICEKFEEDAITVRKSFHQVPGRIVPGDHFSIVIIGPGTVKCRSDQIIEPGEILAAGSEGIARKVRTRNLDGILVAENIGIIGKAMERHDGSGTLKVYVNCK